MITSIRTGIAAALTVAFAATGLGATAAHAAEGKLVVGAYPANPPWEYKTEKGTFEGFEVDLVTEVAKRLDRELEISDLGFQALFAATASGRIDLAISTITITDERLQSQSFTQGYFDADLGLGVKEGGGVESLDDMKGKVVGALASSTGDAWIRAHADEMGFSDIKTYPDQNSLLLDVQSGRIAGAVNDELGFNTQAEQMKGLKIVQTISTGDRYGLMLPKGSPLLEPVNNAITEIKKDGTLSTIYEKWLGDKPREDSATVTVLDLPTAK